MFSMPYCMPCNCWGTATATVIVFDFAVNQFESFSNNIFFGWILLYYDTDGPPHYDP